MNEEVPPHPVISSELLLLVYLHGFKGGEDTFSGFPERVEHLLTTLQPDTRVLSVVYPPYETRGDLNDAVVRHVSWLEETVAKRTEEYKKAGGTGNVRVVLLGHSMGGLVVADSALAILNSAAPRPDILGMIAYDTPYWGLNPAVFKNTAEKYLGYAQQGHTILTGLGVGFGAFKAFTSKGGTEPPVPSPPASSSSASASSSKKKSELSVTPVEPAKPASNASSSWFSMPVVAGAAALVAGAGAAYWNREGISDSWSWATSHLSFVGELWKMDVLEGRLAKVAKARKGRGVRFHCFYTFIPSSIAFPSSTRTFIVLPPNPYRASFTPNSNTRAADEIGAHTEMFTELSDGIYKLGGETCELISGWLKDARSGNGKGNGAGEKMV